MIKEEPGLVEDQQGRPAVEPGLEFREQVCQHGCREPLFLHQGVHFEAEHVAGCQTVLIGIEQRAIGADERIGFQRLSEFR